CTYTRDPFATLVMGQDWVDIVFAPFGGRASDLSEALSSFTGVFDLGEVVLPDAVHPTDADMPDLSLLTCVADGLRCHTEHPCDLLGRVVPDVAHGKLLSQNPSGMVKLSQHSGRIGPARVVIKIPVGKVWGKTRR